MQNPTTLAVPQAAAAPTKVRWKIFLMMLFLIAVNYIDRASLSVAMPMIAKEFDLSPAIQGLLMSSFFWTYAFMQIPGGMLTNLYNQLKAQGAEDRFDEVLAEMPNVRRDLGYPPLVTPTSQITGSAAALNVLYGRYKIVTNEVRDIVRGKYGRVPGKIDEKFRKMCIGDEPVITHRPADDLEPELEKSKKALADEGFPDASPEDVLSYTLFPEVALPFFRKRDNK